MMILSNAGLEKAHPLQQNKKSNTLTGSSSPNSEKTYLSNIARIRSLALAILATITILPYCLYEDEVRNLWQQAISGVKQKVVMVDENTSEKRVQFGDVRARVFDKEQPPIDVQNVQSIVLINQSGKKDGKNSISSQKRKIPPIGMYDTIVIRKGEEVKSVHGTGELFNDREIVEKLPIVKRQEIGGGIDIEFTKHGKAIIQQQATRGCTAATAAMLIVDHGKKPDLLQLRTRNLGHVGNQLRDIRAAGLLPVIHSADTLSKLRNLIIENSSAIVALNGKLGGHVIIVDQISEDLSNILLRDPYHGWEITVTREAFLKEWKGGKVIQIIKE